MDVVKRAVVREEWRDEHAAQRENQVFPYVKRTVLDFCHIY